MYAKRLVVGPAALLFLATALLCAAVFGVHSSKRLLNPAAYDQSRTHKIRCYSCMSTFYESAWVFLSQAFSKPLNFTGECDSLSAKSRVGMVDCYSVCITMWEDTTLLGMPFRGYMRGCYDSMLVQGFNQTIVRWYRWLHRDSCHFYNKQEVLQLPFKDRKSFDRTEAPSNQMLHICTCYSNGCNGAESLSTAGGHRFGQWPSGSSASLMAPLSMLLVGFWGFLYD